MTTLSIYPDRWLICSSAVEELIRGPWADHYGAGSLMDLRLRSRQVESLPTSAVFSRVRDLVACGCGTLHIVVERMGQEEQDLVTQLEDIDASMRLHVWSDGPLDALGSLSTPEEAVLLAWQSGRSMPQFQAAGVDWPETWNNEFRKAIAHWERAVRQDFPEEMQASFDPQPSSLTSLVQTGRLLISSLAAAVRGHRWWVEATAWLERGRPSSWRLPAGAMALAAVATVLVVAQYGDGPGLFTPRSGNPESSRGTRGPGEATVTAEDPDRLCGDLERALQQAGVQNALAIPRAPGQECVVVAETDSPEMMAAATKALTSKGVKVDEAQKYEITVKRRK